MTNSIAKTIENFLTFRYDSSSTPGLPMKTWKDFEPTEKDTDGYLTECYLRRSIYDTLKHKKKIAVALSSGIDSALVLGLVRTTLPRKHIIAVTHQTKHNEIQEARRIADHFGVEHYVIEDQGFIEQIPQNVKILQEPKWNTYTYHLFDVAKSLGADVLVTGDGADELFAGYIFRYKQFLESNNQIPSIKYIENHVNDWVDDQHFLCLKNGVEFWHEIMTPIREYFSSPIDALDQILLADYNGKFIFDFVKTMKGFAKHYCIDYFSPYVQIRDFATHISNNDKFDGKTGKITLHKIAKRLDLTVTTKKIGYSLDFESEWKKNKKMVLDILLDKNAKIYRYVNYEWVLLHQEQEDIRHIFKFLQLYAIEAWLNMI